MNTIRAQFEKFVTISDEQWNIFYSRLEKIKFPKKKILLKEGEVEKYLSFIEKGIVRYFIPGIENDVTFDFGFENEFISGYDSFLKQEPSIYQVETLTETILWRLTYSDLQDIYKESGIGNLIGRYAAEGLYLKKTKREKSLLSETAEERYLNLLKEQSKLLKYIPLKYIASYIGVTPQALSRIRRRIS
jgi:CRP-like cAMP-binding protein